MPSHDSSFSNMWQAMLRLLRAIWHRLCGYRSLQTTDQTEQQRLLSVDGASSSPLVAAAHPLAAAPAEPSEPATIIVMRHGHRQDEEDAFWHQTAARPWDPPLSAKGKTQAAEAAGVLLGLTVDYVISSPFRRCLQTAAGVVRGLPGLSEGHWLADWQFAEVCEPRVLFGVRSDARSMATGSDVEAWMWGGIRLDAALDRFVREDCRLVKVPVRPQARQTGRPEYPEDLEQGLTRYSRGLQEVAQTFAGKTILVVTHGECVRQAVLMAQPQSEVFEVKHTGYVVLHYDPQQQQHQHQRQQHGGRLSPAGGLGAPAGWQLKSEPGETGVLWLEDDD